MTIKVKYKKYWRKTSLKQKGVGNFFLKHVEKTKPKNFLEIGVFHGVTSRNVCDLLNAIHGDAFKFTGIDLFSTESEILKDEHSPKIKFSNPLKILYYKYIIKLDPYSMESVEKLLKKYKKNINIIKGNSNKVLGNPLNSLLWLINTLSMQGKKLSKNCYVSTGTCTPAIPISKGDSICADFGKLGKVKFNYI